jgi:hypothetical protein
MCGHALTLGAIHALPATMEGKNFMHEWKSEATAAANAMTPIGGFMYPAHSFAWSLGYVAKCLWYGGQDRNDILVADSSFLTAASVSTFLPTEASKGPTKSLSATCVDRRNCAAAQLMSDASDLRVVLNKDLFT